MTTAGIAPGQRGGIIAPYTFVDWATQLYQVLVVLLTVFFHNSTVTHWQWRVTAHVVAMLITHGLVWRCSRPGAGVIVQFLRHFYPVLFYTWFFTETGALNRMFVDGYLDETVIRIEQALFGFQPSILFMEKLPYLFVSEVFYISYFSYYVMIFGVGLALYLRSRKEFFHYISVISFVFYACYTIYIFLPVIGPRVFAADTAEIMISEKLRGLAPEYVFPANIKLGPFYNIMAWIYATFEPGGAAMPSSHVAVSLCTVYFSFRYLPRIRFFHLTMAVLLCLSTVYCRYHYAADVIAGVMTATILLPLGNWLYSLKPGAVEN